MKIKIGPFWVLVEYVNDLKTFGETDFATLTIKIRAGMPEDLTGETLMHEILHMCFFILGKGKKEATVRGLSPLLFEMFKDQPLGGGR